MNPYVAFCLLLLAFAQNLEAQHSHGFVIDWQDTPGLFTHESYSANAPTFGGALHSYESHFAPMLLERVALGRNKKALNVTVEVLQTMPLDQEVQEFMRAHRDLEPGSVLWDVKQSRGESFLIVEYLPIIEQNGSFVRVLEGRIKYSTASASVSARGDRADFATNSLLFTGEWYRLAVLNDGIYRLDYRELQEMGIDVNGVSPQDINIFGYGFGQLPFENSVPRPDDMLVNRIHFEGENDGSIDEGDFILFFARGPHTWTYNETSGLYNHNQHEYTDTSYYFIGVNTGIPAQRIANVSSSASPSNYIVDQFDDYAFHEVDRENVLKSGREWYGEKFDVQTSYSFSGSPFNFPNIVPGAETVIRANVLGRSTAGLTRFTLATSNQFITSNINGISSASFLFGNTADMELRITNAPALMNITLGYDKSGNPSASGWLNWLNVNTKRQLRMAGNQMLFRAAASVGAGRISRFEVGNAQNILEIWEVTEPHNAGRIVLSRNGEEAVFTLPTSTLREFIAFNGSEYFTPLYTGRVTNQNLHALGTTGKVDMVIIAPGFLRNRAEELADIHRNYEPEPLNVEVVGLQQVYNEFSSGMRDITAIKWLMKMLYDRAAGDPTKMPRFLTLFGDGSFDNRNTTPGNTNLIPTYQSENSLSSTNSYVSDDYFALLDDDEGESPRDLVDIGVGRLTIKNAQEATSVINKIRRYMEVQSDLAVNCSTCNTNDGGFGSWRNNIALVADDGDGNDHMIKSQSISNRINGYTQNYNLERIFLDAFQRIATPGGGRYPDANLAIDRRVQNGAFIINFIGHGGVLGWTQERVLDIPTILDWDNRYAMPIFLTATCEFTRFDDPLRTSAGEYVLLNGNGGGVALLTTTRLVFSGANFRLNERFYDALFERPEGETVTRLGDVCRDNKNSATTVALGSTNHRNFTLVGDPALPMAIPRKRAVITSITDTLGQEADTLKALGIYRVAGEIQEPSGVLASNFNGRLSATVFDRVKEVTSLANGGGNPFQFEQQEDVVYRGNAEVVNGRFRFDFVIPKDISFAVDSTARISLYAFSENEDGAGFVNNLNIGDRDTSAIDDGSGPDVELFLNDENFVFGGFTNATPTLVARVFDPSGINTVGTGVGHDITAQLDNDPQKIFILNDFYESDLNTFQSGRIRYQFDELEPGNHELSLKVWNVHNRSTETKTSFVVSENEDFAIERVLNYPNPFNNYTEFSFEHNQSCAFLNVMIQVYTVSGKLVKNIVTVSNTDGFRTEPIIWDGRDDYGDRLATGVYVYKVSVRNPAGEQVEKFEKLVILN